MYIYLAKNFGNLYNISVIMTERDTEEKKVLNEEPFKVDSNDLKNTLHLCIVAITFLTHHKQLGVGSGILISSNLVLTVAHNFYDKNYNSENEHFKIYCEVKGEVENFYEVESFRYLESFKTCSKSSRMEHDFALVKLKTSLPFKEYMPLSLVCKKCIIENNNKTHL
jgi:V8-like Glu-specific endopeptidase